jgi:ACS family D-galactonate transporter-like MFS transporter
VGALGIAYGLVWYRLYRDPDLHPKVNNQELELIAADGAIVDGTAALPFRWANIVWLLRQRQVLGAAIGQFATNSTLVFFLTWFPTYLAVERKMGWIKVGFFAVLPFIAASFGVLIGGQLSDWLVKRSGSLSFGRKLPIVVGLMMSSLIVSAIWLKSDIAVIAVLSLAFFGQGMSNLGWTLISEVAPSKLVGLTAGVFNLCTNLAGIITPIVIGILVEKTGSFMGGLAFIAAAALIGALSYTFVVGKVERLPNP